MEMEVTKSVKQESRHFSDERFKCGVIVNIWLGWNIWDYSNTPFNILGQVCLPFALIWFVLAHAAIVLDDYLRYWLLMRKSLTIRFGTTKNKKR